MKFITQHWSQIAALASGIGGLHLFSAFVDSMEPLPPNAGWWAKTFYKTVQSVAGNYSRVK